MSPLDFSNPEAGFIVGDTDATSVVAAAGAIDFPYNVPARKARVKSHSIVIPTAPTDSTRTFYTHTYQPPCSASSVVSSSPRNRKGREFPVRHVGRFSWRWLAGWGSVQGDRAPHAGPRSSWGLWSCCWWWRRSGPLKRASTVSRGCKVCSVCGCVACVYFSGCQRQYWQ